MILIDNKATCCGCGACCQVCPQQCISMLPDAEGFLYPFVDNSKCISCNLCEKSCPIKKQKNLDNANNIVNSAVAYAKSEKVRENSSSGGIFSLIATQIIEDGGIVFGAAFDDQMLVKHIGIDSLSDLYKLRGSKYLQSRVEDTYIQTKKLLDEGQKVLYSGTACQIAGLKAFLKKDYEQLYTVDVLCHGVPSPTLWKHYIERQEQVFKSKVKKVSFRNKNSGWRNFSIVLHFCNGKKYEVVYSKDPFMRLFLQNACLRPSCHDCKFKMIPRISDISLGDCWDIANCCPELDDDRGISVVITHTSKGKILMDTIKESYYASDVEIDKALPPHADSRNSVKPHTNRDKVFIMLQKGSKISDIEELLLFSRKERIIVHWKRTIISLLSRETSI